MNTSISHSDGSPSKKKAKLECSYGERCYRKKPEHFQEYIHPHLNNLLERMGDKIVIPANYKLKISKQTLTEQLQIVRNLTIPENLLVKSQSPSPSKKPENSPKSMSTPPMKPRNRPISSGSESSPSSSSSPDKNSPLPLKKTHGNKEEPRNERWEAHMNIYKQEAQKKIKLSVKEKMEAAAPYNIFLTTIKDSQETHKEQLSISFPELLDPYFGQLESSLQINFMIEFGFLLAQYSITGHKSRPLTLLYGDVDCELDRFSHFLTHAKVIPPSNFGSHHTLWISPECPVMKSKQEGSGDSVTNFKKDILAYLSAYNLPCLNTWIEALKEVDMSAIKTFRSKRVELLQLRLVGGARRPSQHSDAKPS